MSQVVSLIAFSGSTRAGSHNRVLLKVATAAAERAGAKVSFVELRDLALPLYDADFETEHGLPPALVTLKAACVAADGYLIAAPEYNGSLSAVLKNTIDWLSRPGPQPGETPFTLAAFRGKVAGLMSASPGAWGGMRGLMHLREILSGVGVLVAAEQFALPAAHAAFKEDGRLDNQVFQTMVEGIGARTAQLARALKAP
jgi:NAD(P)H-dependent FMN reductase